MKSKITAVKDGIYRVQLTSKDQFGETLLSKYGFIKEGEIKEKETGKIKRTFDKSTETVHFEGGKRSLDFKLFGKNGERYEDQGFQIEILLEEKERLFGLGDETRESVMKRGRKAIMWQKNVVTYGPIPFMVSSCGWGIMMNCTYKMEFDLAATRNDTVIISADKGVIDFYLFIADKMMDVISLYTELMGRPVMLPRAAYGLTFVNNEEVGARDALTNAHNFRKEEFPCDIMGFEPEWMETHYDYSTQKRWNRKKFYIPYWLPEDHSGTGFFGHYLKKMNFKYTLWLCCDYDLLWKEEGSQMEYDNYEYKGATIKDDHFRGDVVMDMITKPGEDWFEHLKKYVKQGASGFKLDGAMQVMEHPDRLWAGKYRDDEVHNIYPLIYARQMHDGFEECSGMRALIYTPCLYAGTQHYAATWAGDTGGGNPVLMYILNMAFCGHTNAACDVKPEEAHTLHFGFLMPWTQVLSWVSYFEPWFLGEEAEKRFRWYARLRSSLFPYIYSTAYHAAKTGIPSVRPLSMVYEETDIYDNAQNVYMFGNSLLVGAFDMHIDLPQGRWYDYFTGDFYEGGQTIDYVIPEGKGGALFMKEGSVIVTQRPKRYLDEKVSSDYQIELFPGEDCEFVLYEDDGITTQYLDGNCAATRIMVRKETEKEFVLTVGKREMENKKYQDIGEKTGFRVKIYYDMLPKKIMVDGQDIDFEVEEKNAVRFYIPMESHEERDVLCKIVY